MEEYMEAFMREYDEAWSDRDVYTEDGIEKDLYDEVISDKEALVLQGYHAS